MDKRRLITNPSLSAVGATARRTAELVQTRPRTALLRRLSLVVVLASLAVMHEVSAIAGCMDGETTSCPGGGTKECENGHWGPCTKPGEEPPLPRCLEDTTGRLTATPQVISLGQSVTFQWDVSVPSGCTGLLVFLDGKIVPSTTGSLTVQPVANKTYYLQVESAGLYHALASVPIAVQLGPTVMINANHMESLLLQALRFDENKDRDGNIIDPEARRYIYIANDVELDLSHLGHLSIAAGVTLAGGRTAREPGPRLYTTTHPGTLFNIQSDNVRITGVRIEGPDVGTADGNDTGIAVDSQIGIEIDNNEIYGWIGAAVSVKDSGGRIDYVVNPDAVHIHDNYIHHNEHPSDGDHAAGYGVVVGAGAYALIERNVFDWNRHAITGDGREGTGYLAYRNLVLEHGGVHYCVGGLCWHTHQFDMHGRDTCGIGDIFSDTLYNCGLAGEYLEIMYNSFLNVAGHAFKLRGTPMIDIDPDDDDPATESSADVAYNVFAHTSLFNTTEIGALEQTESGLNQRDNLVGVNGLDERSGGCDFDGDSVDDSFLATGQTWWFSSGGDRPWRYLNTSTKRRSQLTLNDVSGDGVCDVTDNDGVVYLGGVAAPL